MSVRLIFITLLQGICWRILSGSGVRQRRLAPGCVCLVGGEARGLKAAAGPAIQFTSPG